MRPVIVTAATPGELSLLIGSLEGRERLQICRRDAYIGQLAGWKVIAAVTGIGKTNTAAAVAVLIERFQPELVINTGCAGAYAEMGLGVGDIAMASDEVLGDEGVMASDGWHSLELIGIPVVERSGELFFNRFPLSGWAIDKAGHVAATHGITLHRGTFVTVSAASGTRRRGDELARRFEAVCENMEGGAAAQVALLHGVDCLEVRGISNIVEDRDLSRWNIPLAVERVQTFIVKLIESLIRI